MSATPPQPPLDPSSPDPSAGGRVEVRGDVVIKVQHPALAALELEKTRAAQAVAERTGDFSVPAIVEADLDAGRLVFTTVPGLRPVRAFLAQDEWTTWADAAAQALAGIHRHLRLPPARVRPVPSPLDGAPRVWLHGDYSPTNVQVQAATGKLWVLDWLGPGWLDAEATTGPAAHDLASFVLPLFWQRPGDPLAVPHPEARALRFLRAYPQAPLAQIGRVGLALQRTRFPHAASLVRPSGVLARMPWQVRCWRFFKRLGDDDAPGTP